MKLKPTIAAFCAALVLAGCGGKEPPQPLLRMGSSEFNLPYGVSAGFWWDSRDIKTIRQEGTNFKVAESQINSSFMDRPAATTTYVMEAVGTDNRPYSASLTLYVQPTQKSYLIVGDQSQQGMAEIVELVQGTTQKSVQTSATIPPTITTDVVILFANGDFGPADQGAIAAHLAADKGVVIVGKAAAKLATGNENGSDLTSISRWLGGATALRPVSSTDPGAFVVSAAPAIPLSATLFGDPLATGLVAPEPVSAFAVPLAEPSGNSMAAFTYDPPGGGFLGYVGAEGLRIGERDDTTNGLLLAAARWVADGFH